MATIDVSELSRETLAPAAFPVSPQADFRVAFAEPVHRGINAHAGEETSVEICGVLVGSWAQDANGPYAVIEQFIRCNAATQKFAEVTFTHESWAHINQEMDTKYQNLRIIGWYHSHPNFGIFLSDRDCFIQENFFSGPGQVAFVVDPVRKLEGLFEWRKGKPVPMHHYWVGGRVQVGEVQPAPPPSLMMTAASAEGPSSGSVPDSWTFALTLLLGLCMGLMGYLWGGQRTAWQEQRLEAGAVAHYGLWKLYKPNFEENLQQVILFQNQTFQRMQKLSQEHVAGAGDKQADVKKRWHQIYEDLDEGTKAQLMILKEYGMSDAERAEIRQLLAQKQEELPGKTLAPTPKVSPKPKSKSEKPEAKPPTDDKGKTGLDDKAAPQKPAVQKPAEKPAATPAAPTKPAAAPATEGPTSSPAPPQSKPPST